MKKNLVLVPALIFSLLITSCSNPETSPDSTSEESTRSLSDISTVDPVNPTNEGDPQDPPQDQAEIITPQILLFNGIGTSVSDWRSLEAIIKSMGLTYRLVNSYGLNSMSLLQMKKYKLILIPGGNSNTINNALYASTRIRVRQAVRDGGVSYLGICAGAFAGIGTDARSNTTAYYGFAVALGEFLKHWYPNGDSSLIAAVPMVTFADGTRRYLMWWDGPKTPEWPRGVVARYPDGKPAISQAWNGLGFVVVSGPHPEAPASWQYDSGKDPDGLDHDIAAKLIRSALYRRPLPVY